MINDYYEREFQYKRAQLNRFKFIQWDLNDDSSLKNSLFNSYTIFTKTQFENPYRSYKRRSNSICLNSFNKSKSKLLNPRKKGKKLYKTISPKLCCYGSKVIAPQTRSHLEKGNNNLIPDFHNQIIKKINHLIMLNENLSKKHQNNSKSSIKDSQNNHNHFIINSCFYSYFSKKKKNQITSKNEINFKNNNKKNLNCFDLWIQGNRKANSSLDY